MKLPAGGLLVALLIAAVLALQAPSSARADISGPCDATVNGESIAGLDANSPGDAIEVEKDSTLDVGMTSAGGFQSHKINLEIYGLGFSLQDRPDNGDAQWSGTVQVNDYAKYGVGLYKVVGEGRLADGSVCSGAVLINVKGSPFGTVAGLAALAAGIFGTVLLVGTGLSSVGQTLAVRGKVRAWAAEQLAAIQRGEAPDEAALAAGLRAIVGRPAWIQLWLLAALPALLLAGSIPGGGATAPPSPPRAPGLIRLPRNSWLPRLSVFGSVGGVLLSEAVLVLLQQFAVTPLTQSSAGLGLVGGLGMAVVFTSTIRFWNNFELNSAVASAEARFNQAIEQMRAEAGLPPSTGAPGPSEPPAPGPREPPHPEPPAPAGG